MAGPSPDPPPARGFDDSRARQNVVSASDSDTSVKVDKARSLLLAQLRAMPAEAVPLAAALGRVLGADVRASTDLPGVDNSAMDGYALFAAGVADAAPSTPVLLPLGGESRAGRRAPDHRRGTATLISTGAPVPRGANAVIPVELTRRIGQSVETFAEPSVGRHIRRRGEDQTAGSVLLSTGHRLRSVDIGVCAAGGVADVSMAQRPRVAILSNGDELVNAGVPTEPYQVTDVNSPMLAAPLLEAGGIPVVIGCVGDERHAVEHPLETAAATADFIVSTAGVSMSRHDHLRDAIAKLGAVHVRSVAMRPGKPLVIGRVGSIPFLGLPGNPVSSAVVFLVFARAAILHMQGAKRIVLPAFHAVLGEGFEKPASLETYALVRLDFGEQGAIAWSSGGRGSAAMHGLGAADALAVLPPGQSVFPVSASILVLLLP